MSDMPKEIWVINNFHESGEYRYKLDGAKKHPQQDITKYIRADLVEPKAIRADIADAKHPKQDAIKISQDMYDKIMENAHKVFRKQTSGYRNQSLTMHDSIEYYVMIETIRNYIEGKDND